jgi:hypothetical protein
MVAHSFDAAPSQYGANWLVVESADPGLLGLLGAIRLRPRQADKGRGQGGYVKIPQKEEETQKGKKNTSGPRPP